MADINKQLQPYSTKALMPDIMQFYQMLTSSPQFQQMLSQQLGTASTFGRNLQAGLQSSGVGQSGVGQIANAAAMSAGNVAEGALRGGLFGQAMDTANQNLMARLQAFTTLRSQQMQQGSPLEKFLGNLFGAGSMALPYFFAPKAPKAGG